MRYSRFRTAAIAAGLALGLAAAPALAEVTDLPDPDQDAVELSIDGLASGDFEIDLRNVRIDHGTKSIMVTSTFSYLVDDSWTTYSVKFDTDQDGVQDHVALWGLEEDVAGVVQVDAEGNSLGVTCTSIGISRQLGVNGTATLNIPRSCLGNPASVAVNVFVTWEGLDTGYNELYYWDTAPGSILDDPIPFSIPVTSSNTGTVTSPQPPRIQTQVVASLSKTKQVRGKTPATLKVRVSGGGGPAGNVKVTDGSRVLRTLSIPAGRTVSYRLPKTLKVGVHRIKVTFTPSSPAKFSGSSKTLQLRVVRR